MNVNSNTKTIKGLVSFCCLGYNHGEYLEECIKSIWSQEYTSIEIIALDDGSQDGSSDILKKCEKKSPIPMTIILQNNSGNIAKNFNTLISKANGEFLFFIALDDVVKKKSLSSKVPFFNKDNNLVFVANTSTDYIDGKSNIIERDVLYLDWSTEDYNNASELLELEYKYIGTFYIQGTLFKKEAVLTVNGFDDDLLGDDIILRTKIFNYMVKNEHLTFKLLSQPGVSYRHHDSNIHKNSVRQIRLVKEWKDRYFPERRPPLKFIEWIKNTIHAELSTGKLDNIPELINILKDLNFKTDDIPKVIHQMFLLTKDYRYLIPFIFEIRVLKMLNRKEAYIRILGIKIIELRKVNNYKMLYFCGIKVYELK
ncbi:MAG: glycosyltransferase family 2 protein [Fibrobacterales bacterium]